jgi:hypothetical protein
MHNFLSLVLRDIGYFVTLAKNGFHASSSDRQHPLEKGESS